MKKIILLLSVLILVTISCSKTDNSSVLVSTITTPIPTVDYATLIVGSWHLAEKGILMNSNSGGCGEGSSYSNNVAWAQTNEVEKLTFNTDGTFQQEASNDATCKGKYVLSNGYISINTNCGQVALRQPITSMSKTTLILEKSDGDHNTQYKYHRL